MPKLHLPGLRVRKPRNLPGLGARDDEDPESGPSESGPSESGPSESGPSEAGPPEPHAPEDAGLHPAVERAAPETPLKLPRKAWWAVLRGSLREFKDDELTDRAAALTYYGVLALFPALLVLVSVLGMAGRNVIDEVLSTIRQLTPGPARDLLTRSVEQLHNHGGTGSVMAAVGLVLAVWSASSYFAAFIRAANAVYDIPEGRPVWKILPLRLGVTVVLMVVATASALIVVFTGGLARRTGQALGVGDAGLTVWSIAKWPVLVVLVTFMIAILYRSAPNAKVKGFRWLTPGSFLALLIWLIASAGLGFYVSHFASYNKTYGTMAGVIVFLIWLWISNLAILLGLEFDAESVRQRAVEGGLPPDAEPYTQPRDTATWDAEDIRRLEERDEYVEELEQELEQSQKQSRGAHGGPRRRDVQEEPS